MDALMESSLVSPQGSSTGQGASDAQRLQLQEASVPTVPWKMRRVPQYATGCHGRGCACSMFIVFRVRQNVDHHGDW